MPAFSRFLRYFTVVGRHGSIRRAADELNVSPSAIARQILNVEAELGTPLFERLPGGLRLTAAGEIMMAAGHRWQKNLADVRAQIEDLRGLKRGHVEIAIIDALTRGVIPEVIHTIGERYPGISLNLHVQSNEEVRRLVAAGEVEFGILFEPHSYRDLTVQAFVEVVLGFVTRPDHKLAQEAEARFSACVGEPLIVPSEGLAIGQQIAVLQGALGTEMVRKVSADNIELIAALVQQGTGIGILSSLDVIGQVEAGTLSFVRIADPMLRPMTLALCTNAARRPSYAADLVLAEVAAAFARLGYNAAA